MDGWHPDSGPTLLLLPVHTALPVGWFLPRLPLLEVQGSHSWGLKCTREKISLHGGFFSRVSRPKLHVPGILGHLAMKEAVMRLDQTTASPPSSQV